MSTHCTIGYETPDGGYVGVYVHFDGGPHWILPRLQQMSWDEVTLQVHRALLQGGGRCLTDGLEIETYEQISDPTRWMHTTWPCTFWEYNYRVRLDGKIDCITSNGTFIPAIPALPGTIHSSHAGGTSPRARDL